MSSPTEAMPPREPISAQRKGAGALVTGGASGIGRAVCRCLAREGWAIGVADIDGEKAEQVAREICAEGGRALALAADVVSEEAVRSAVERARAAWGHVLVLVHAAGICTFEPLANLSPEMFDRTLAVHLRGAFLCARAVLPDMQRAGWGRIVNIASVAGLNGGGAGLSHYAAAKAGIVGFTKALALELAPAGITCNVVAPGLVDTPLVRAAGLTEQTLHDLAQRIPVRRIGHPEDVAHAVAFLVSEQAGYVTGQVLSPNGGSYL